MRIVNLYSKQTNLYNSDGNRQFLQYLADKNPDQIEFFDTFPKDHNNEASNKSVDLVLLGETETVLLPLLQKQIAENKAFLDYIENDGKVLLTGNSGIIFGNHYTLRDGSVHSGLQLFDFEAKYRKDRENYGGDLIFEINEQQYFGNQIFTFEVNLKQPEHALGKVVYGYGNNGGSIPDQFEPKQAESEQIDSTINGLGYRYKNCFWTNSIGPLFTLNPSFLTDVLGFSELKIPNKYLEFAQVNLEKSREFINNLPDSKKEPWIY